MMDTKGVNEWKMMDTEEVRECKKYTRRHVKRLCVLIAGGILMSGEKKIFSHPTTRPLPEFSPTPEFP